ncbi:hypothetical protein NMG60_11019008 [Bertholletia excelsa]
MAIPAATAATAPPGFHFQTPSQLRHKFQFQFPFQFHPLCHPLYSSSASVPIKVNPDIPFSGTFDPDLRTVLELATDSELFELERILFGPSYFSPMLKSIAKGADVDYFMIQEDPKERDDFIAILESRFLFLAADARSTLRGWRPSYRSVLLGVREKLNIPCSTKLSTDDLEAEIFLHLLEEYSSAMVALLRAAMVVPLVPQAKGFHSPNWGHFSTLSAL